MNFKIFTIVPIIGIFLLTACEKETPKCSDSQVKELVITTFHKQAYDVLSEKMFPSRQRAYYTKERLEEEMANLKVSLFKQFPGLDLSKTKYEVDGIRTIQKDKETNAHVCAGVIKTYNKETKEQIGEANVAYLVQLTDDKKSFYVTLEMQ